MSVLMTKYLNKDRYGILYVFMFFLLGQVLDSFILSPLLDKVLSSASFTIVNTIYKLLEVCIYIVLNKYLLNQKISWKLAPTVKTSIGVGLIIIAVIFRTISNPSRAINGIILMSLVAIVEEYINRGLFTGRLVEVIIGKKKSLFRVFEVLVISGLLFGLYHFSNLNFQSLAQTCSQMIQASGLGAFLAALYLRTGSLIIPILVHFAWDYSITIQRGISSTTPSKPYFIVSIIVCVAFLLISLFITRNTNKLRLLK